MLAAEVVLSMLEAFIDAEPMLMLKTIAQRAQMHPAKAHRYLVSLCRAGFVRQNPNSGLYQLADGALRLGLAAIEGIDPIAASRPILRSLREATRHSAMLALWDVAGPVVALREIQRAPLLLTTRVGSSLPLLATSTGWTFCAWLPRAIVAPALERAGDGPEVEEWRRDPDRMEAVLEKIRRMGVTSSRGQMNSRVHGLSAPVFDLSGHIAAVASVFAAAGQIDLNLEGATAQVLKEHARQISLELGWRPAI